MEQADRRAALLALVGATESYLDELEAAAAIPASQNPQPANERIDAQADEAASALAAAEALSKNDALAPPSVSAAPLARVLGTRHQDYRTYRQRLAQARAINEQRATRLASVLSFTGSFDGILSRYSASRDELADWTAKVASEGVTYTEAYAVLKQQVERREQLRDELAALSASAEFATFHTDVLALMDSAISATEDASRGISEYQLDDSYTYYSYDETPGWTSFREASHRISDSYDATLSAYAQQKQTLTARLSKREPLPKPPA